MSAEAPRRAAIGWATPLGLCVALIGPALMTATPLLGIPGAALDDRTAIWINETAMWSLTLTVLAIVKFGEKSSFASIGLVRPTFRAIGFGGIVTIGLIFLAVVAGQILQAMGLPIDDQQADFLKDLPIWLKLGVAASAGATEEVLFRGYPISRLTTLTGSRWIGALVPVIVFGLLHAPFWGWAHALVAGLSGLWLTLLFLWRRNLCTNIAAHALMDAVALLSISMATDQDGTLTWAIF